MYLIKVMSIANELKIMVVLQKNCRKPQKCWCQQTIKKKHPKPRSFYKEKHGRHLNASHQPIAIGISKPYTCVRDLFIGGGYLPYKKNYKIMVFFM